MKVKAKDIAKHLGLSPSAVSLVLNDKPGVSIKTREKVLAAANRMGYQFNNKSKNFQGKNIRYVIFLKNGDTVKETSFYSIVLKGIENCAKEFNYNVFISYFYEDGDWLKQIEAMSKDVHGIIILATELQDSNIKKAYDLGVASLGLPIVLVDNATSLVNVDCVVSDSVRGAYDAAMFLLKNGHPDIGYLRSKSRIDNFEERLLGLQKARKEWGVPESQKLQIVDVNIASEKAFEDMTLWLENNGKPMSAYFADNDIIAAACIRALKGKGYLVPEDVSIVGYDDMPICTMVDPPLTTIQVMKEQLGIVAMQILHSRITQKSDLEDDCLGVYRVFISTKFIKRDSASQFKG